MSKKKNKRSLKLSSYYNNSPRKSFDFTMNRIYDLLEKDSYLEEQTEFLAKIISGNVTGDTSANQFDSFFSFLNGVKSRTYKIRFIDKDSKFNTFEDPSNYAGESREALLISLHPEAFQETPAQNTVLAPNSIVIVSDVDGDGVYKIEKVLEDSEMTSLGYVSSPKTAKDSFAGGGSSFLGNLFDTSPGDWNKGSGVVFRNSEEEERATQFLNELSKKAVPLGIPVYVNSAYRDPKSQARVVAGNTVRENGKNLVVYGAATKRIYLRLAARAHQNPTGPEMKELVEYETKKLAAALKRDPNYQGHGTGYSFDLKIRGLNQSKLSTYRSLIEDLGASVLYETHPPHYHINLRTWKPKDKTVVEKGYDALDKLTKMFKEEPEE